MPTNYMSQFIAQLGVQVRHATTDIGIIRLWMTVSSEASRAPNAVHTARLLHTAIPLGHLNTSNRLIHSWYTVYKIYETHRTRPIWREIN